MIDSSLYYLKTFLNISKIHDIFDVLKLHCYPKSSAIPCINNHYGVYDDDDDEDDDDNKHIY